MPSTPPQPTIRYATPDDAQRCGDIAVAAWQRVYDAWLDLLGQSLWAQNCAGWEPDKRSQVEAHIRDHEGLAIVTELEGSVVGFLTFHPHTDKNMGEIGNNAVDPDYQGRGIGTLQCKRALEIFRERGMTAAKVGTGLDEGHAPARAMYEKAGFDRSTPHVTYYMKL